MDFTWAFEDNCARSHTRTRTLTHTHTYIQHQKYGCNIITPKTTDTYKHVFNQRGGTEQ